MWEAVEGKRVECGWGDGAVRWTGVDVCVCMCLWCVCASWVFMCGRRMQGLSGRCVYVSVVCLCVVGVYVREKDARFVSTLKGVRDVSMCGVIVWYFVLSKTASEVTL